MPTLREILFPEFPRHLRHTRAVNIALRTAHLAATGVLVGGHAFGVDAGRLFLALSFAIVTGLGLVFVEIYPSCRWLYMGKGVMVLAKLLVLVSILFLWEYRFPLLLLVIVLASVGSHMPSRFRYYSFLHRRVIQEVAPSPPIPISSPASDEASTARHSRPMPR